MADKTGTGERGSTSDVGVFWPVNGGAVVAVVYLRESAAPLAQRNGAIAAMARLVLEEAGSATAPRV
jgi:beta-lactamase class A